AQVYQLRGRVGRGNNRAYAYFLYGRGKHLSEAADKRLQTIFDATELGSGFRISLKDLEIRGAGNLLGPQQSGHIAAVGFDLYCQLLSEAVEELKSGQRKDMAIDLSADLLPTVDLPLSAYIPEDYVVDIMLRIDLYQRLARARTVEGVGQIGEELRDRFGSLPPQAENLLYIVNLRALATRAGIQSISREGKHVTVRLWEGLKLDRGRLRELGQGLKVGTSQLRLDMNVLGNGWQYTLQEVVEALSDAP
ncbi:MAG: transcription-repair coupling factor, partial [Chloroflexi bacterium]|nr:transcription-repair coupling factor [Chloroflexota bacterium]